MALPCVASTEPLNIRLQYRLGFSSLFQRSRWSAISCATCIDILRRAYTLLSVIPMMWHVRTVASSAVEEIVSVSWPSSVSPDRVLVTGGSSALSEHSSSDIAIGRPRHAERNLSRMNNVLHRFLRTRICMSSNMAMLSSLCSPNAYADRTAMPIHWNG